MKQEVSTDRTIRINGADTPISAEKGADFGTFLDGLNRDITKNQQVITTISVNGKALSEKDEAAIRALPIEDVGNVEIFTSSPVDLAYETLDTLGQYIERLMASIDRAAMHYRNKNYIAGDSYFVKSIDGLDLFVQTIGGVKMALRIGLNTKVGLAEATLVSAMNDLLEAKRQNNYIFMAELLQKDLIDNMIEWRDIVFPIFRSWRTS
ncbi:MAG: hypothetical protein HYW49_13450 [Deltaproteobacteria bacterium]|nr:hypothetical protein [Deltaproteobacteria bacterium]